ncbi:hypothetical protein CCAX7_003860 [Capsulimonas corticalis]|uniref:Uncharacterized protein n=1 Tax=Capsulimonas corticalis TaxID=2219043 RepID=A0A402D354_9BACT|nr:tetratricopeptide repeat protein [Capsulimonas corticalis]BDI28335.1 hypothetical protein CCAX7_003860 [Capsulimonas corticalis]
MNTKRRLSLLSAPLAALALTGCSADMQANSKIQDNLVECARQAQIGKTQEARVWADRAIQVDPKKQETYTGALEIDANTPQQMFFGSAPTISIGLIFDVVGDDPTLISYMRDATRKFPGDIEAWELLVEAEDRLGQTAQKTQDAKMMAAQVDLAMRKPKAKIDGKLTAQLGQAYFDAGDEVNGELNYRKGIATYSTDPIPQNGLAYHFAVTNNKPHLKEALDLANQALKLTKVQEQTSGHPEEVTNEKLGAIQDTIGWVQYRQGNYQAALMSLMDAVAGAPDVAEIRYHLAMVYLAMGNAFAARTELRHALLLHPDYADAQTQSNLLQNVPPPKPDPEDDAD